jgi:DNA-binding MarR family transcriptional regulator
MGNVVVAAERLPKLEDYLCFAVYSANLPLHRLLKPLLDEVGLTYPQYLVLIALYDDDHQTVGGLGDKLFLDSSTLTPLLKRMEAMGYVVRQRDPQDERQVRIRLTPRGRSVREKGIGFRADYVETTDLMPAASRQLRQDMAKLRENLLSTPKERVRLSQSLFAASRSPAGSGRGSAVAPAGVQQRGLTRTPHLRGR